MLVERQLRGVAIPIAVAKLSTQVESEITVDRELHLAPVVELEKLKIRTGHRQLC